MDINQHIVIGEARCKLSQIELVRLLGILIDNGVEAVEKDVNNKRCISIEMIEYDDKIFIEAGNPCERISRGEMAKYFKEGYSTKGKDRGLGLYNVKNMVESVKGKILAENKDVDGRNWFFINIEINK